MSRPYDIPHDVWTYAEELASEYLGWVSECWPNGYASLPGNRLRERLIFDVSQAILKARQDALDDAAAYADRCYMHKDSQVAEELSSEEPNARDVWELEAQAIMARMIGRGISSLSQPQKAEQE